MFTAGNSILVMPSNLKKAKWKDECWLHSKHIPVERESEGCYTRIHSQ